MNIVYTKPDCQLAEVTIFAIPKPFTGHIGLIQHNAIASWTKLKPRPEIFLYGDEAGTKEICQELGLIHVPSIQHNEYGTPLLDGIFAQTCDQATNRIIVYLNADVILMDDFLLGVSSCDRQLENYLLIGRRWDIDLEQQLDFNLDWQPNLIQLIREEGCLADYDCKDYFVFPKHLLRDIPAFAVGRGYWDTWMVNHALAANYSVVDCSLAITVVHQNHPYVHIRGGRNEAYMGREAQINKSLGNVTQPGNIACANWLLKPEEYRQHPLVSIVIVIQDDNQEIEKAILSVLIQDYADCEIIVIDQRQKIKFDPDLEVYLKQIKYYFLGTKNEVNAAVYGLEKASGEFMLYLDGNSILLPKILQQIIKYFTHNASTLDVLLAGYKIIKKDKVMEYIPWNDVPNLEKLYFEQSQVKESLLNNSMVVFRARRVKFFPYYCSNQQIPMSSILSHLIFNRGCRVSWFKNIVANIYL